MLPKNGSQKCKIILSFNSNELSETHSNEAGDIFSNNLAVSLSDGAPSSSSIALSSSNAGNVALSPPNAASSGGICNDMLRIMYPLLFKDDNSWHEPSASEGGLLLQKERKKLGLRAWTLCNRCLRFKGVVLFSSTSATSKKCSRTHSNLDFCPFSTALAVHFLWIIRSKPLQIWDKEVVNGHIKRPQDEDIQSNVLEIVGSNIQSTYITCPADPSATLSIKLPFLVMIVKNLKKYFTFEIQVLDDKNVRRRFRASNFQAVTRVKPYICTMPLRMDEGWNQIQFNLADFTRRAYGTNYVETLRVQVHANCRLRRIYFSDRLYSEEELPPEFKLYLPMQQRT
ncbi:PREDICTED: UPF0468 protein CG5343-like [Fragaria vesca subsp. vesca]